MIKTFRNVFEVIFPNSDDVSAAGRFLWGRVFYRSKSFLLVQFVFAAKAESHQARQGSGKLE
jgi:hypothetical protein